MKLFVVNKWTYLYLLLPVVGVIKFLIYDISLFTTNIAYFGYHLFISILISVIGIFFFIKFNTRSHWMNPDHPED